MMKSSLKVKYILIPLMALLWGCQQSQHEHQTIPATFQLEHVAAELEIFAPDLVSTHLYERDIAISTEGDEIIFTQGDYKQSRRCLVRIRKQNDTWGNKEILKISGQYQDIEPFFSPDSKHLFFASNRPMPGTESTDYNIWISAKIDGDWSKPRPLDTIINTSSDEYYPSVSSNGNLYYTATRPEGPGREDLYISRWVDEQYQAPVALDTTINTAVYEFNAYVNPEENILIFSSYGRQDLGGSDLYISQKDASGNWQPARHLPEPFNSPQLDYCPFVDWPRGNFYFTSERSAEHDQPIYTVDEIEGIALDVLNGMGNIYRISWEEVSLEE